MSTAELNRATSAMVSTAGTRGMHVLATTAALDAHLRDAFGVTLPTPRSRAATALRELRQLAEERILELGNDPLALSAEERADLNAVARAQLVALVRQVEEDLGR